MHVYECPICKNRVWFDNLQCSCDHLIGYDPEADAMVAEFTACANRSIIQCNWISNVEGELCRSCAMTQTHPDVTVPENLSLWSKAENAKRWVLANLGRLGWFRSHDDGTRPVFDLLSEKTRGGKEHMVMGHDDGLITINVTEANPAEIVARREQMGEPYRTLIGHFRHEIAHFLFLRLAEHEEFLTQFRALFGDERTDYEAALKDYYQRPVDDSWQHAHISRYASAHPHEDWAETAAHAMHLSDLVDSARAVNFLPKSSSDILTDGMELGIALNHVNRSMGLEDVYPFVVSPIARDKLEFALNAISGRKENPLSDRPATS